MRRPSAPFPEPAHGIAALLGGMLRALLYAVLGLAGYGSRQQRAHDLEGTVALVLAAEAEIDLAWEPYVEWVAVPAPWRNGKLLRPWHAWALSVPLPIRAVRPAVLGRGPPVAGCMHLG